MGTLGTDKGAATGNVVNMTTGKDVVTFLKQQHEQVKAAFAEVLGCHGKDRSEAFYALRRMLAVHETAEEEIVHPVARKKLANGEAIVQRRLEEENLAKKTLAELEDLDVDSQEFEMKFVKLQSDVIAHAEAEEAEEFSQLGDALDPTRLARMRKAVELAEAVAPTRPHAGIESMAANIVAGPFASMLDRARDALTGKSIDAPPSSR